MKKQNWTSWFRAIIVLVLIAGVSGFGWISRAPLLRCIAILWAVSDEYTRADAIVVLGGGIEHRPFAAADLYRQGLAKQILIPNVKMSRAEELGLLPRHGDLTREILLRLGVPAESIVAYGQGVSNTHEEACAVGELARQSGLASLIVVTDAFSSRRVRWSFKREFGTTGVQVGIKVLVPLEYSLDDWWTKKQGVIGFQNEVIKYLYYRFKY